MEKQVIEAIKKIAIEFINAYWNVPYSDYNTLLEWIINSNLELDSEITLDEYIDIIYKDDTLGQAGWIIQEIAIPSEERFKFLNDKLITFEHEQRGYDVHVLKLCINSNWRFFEIFDGGYNEYTNTTKVIHVWREVR